MARSRSLVALLVFVGLTATACTSTPSLEDEARAVLGIPAFLAVPAIPAFNRPTAAKLALGRRVFYDPRLSGNESQSCATCHQQALAFTDGLLVATGSTGAPHHRNSQSLVNAAYNSTFTWANNGLLTLEDQLQVPIRGDRPVELGVNDGNVGDVLARFDGDAEYRALLRDAFPESTSQTTIEKLIFALATFCRSIASANSPYDRFVQGDTTALSESARRGLALFNGERLECFHCHTGVNLSVSYRDIATTEGAVRYSFFNNGLYNVDGTGSYPAIDQGLYDVSLFPADRGRFRPPSLRNVALTAPYMHDGSIATLEDVVRHYAAGGRVITDGPNAGDARVSPLKSGLVRGFAITDEEMADVLAFLHALTDDSVLDNASFAAP